jgi:MOSC domain-containing protein YiiM
MKVISVNIGEPKTITWRGKEVKTGIYKYPVNEPIYLEAEDVKNDHVIDRKHHGGADKACYAYSLDHYNYWKNRYPDVEFHYGIFGENLTVEGLQETDIFIGDIFQMGDARVQATQPRQPCFKLGVRFGSPKIIKQFVDSGFSGVYFRVLKPGAVKAGDQLLQVEKQNTLSVQKVFELLYADAFEKDAVQIALADSNLAESCRKDLIKRWKSYL